ncbi:Os01g0342500, partial [Oryza sativa Japonica Group]
LLARSHLHHSQLVFSHQDDMEASAADHHGGHHHQTTKKIISQGSDGIGGGGGGKSRVDLYAGAVAQRALYGPTTTSRCRGAARQRQQAVAGGKDSKQPSRLSKMSGAEGT